MLTKLRLLVLGLLLALAIPAAAQAKTFYWISHGGPADPVWTYFLAGAKQWAKDTGNTVNTSFHNGDVPSQQEAIRAAIAAKADGIVTTSPDPGSLVEVVKEAQRRRASRSSTSTRPTRTANFNAYVGGDLVVVGKRWAQYLVDKGLVKSGDFVWMPVEVPGATYGVEEEKGIATRLQAARHHLGSHRRHARPGRSHHPHERLPHRQPQQDQGDHRPRRPGDRLDQARVRPGRRQAGRNPGRRLGQLARHHRRKCWTATSTPRMWQDPQATSYIGLSLAAMAAGGIPPGFNVITGALYEKDTAQIYDKIMSGK